MKNSQYYGESQLAAFDLTRAIKLILLVNAGIFVLQILFWMVGLDDVLQRFFSLNWNGIQNWFFWQIFTYMFLHADVFHLFFNMLCLVFLGTAVERGIGWRHLFKLYFCAGIAGGLGWLLIERSGGSCLGASGAVLGVIAAFSALFPHETVLLMMVFPVKAWVLGVLLIGVDLMMMMSSGPSNVAYSAHVVGALAGLVYVIIYFKPNLPYFWLSKLGIRISRHADRRRSKPGSGSQARLSPEDIDRILDKISAKGMNALTRQERRLLEQASRKKRGME